MKKKNIKSKKEKLFRKNLTIRGVYDSRLEAIQMIGQMKVFCNDPRVQERQQQSYIPTSVAYLTYCSDMKAVFHGRPYGRFIEIKSNFGTKKLHRTN